MIYDVPRTCSPKREHASRRALSDDHPETLILMNDMGALLSTLGRRAEVEELSAEAVRRARNTLPAGSWYTAAFLLHHARALLAMERFPKAKIEMFEAHQTFAAALGPDDARTVGAVNSLVDLDNAWHTAEPDQGHDTEAVEWWPMLPEQDGE